MVLDFYTEPSFLDTLKAAVECSNKDTTLFIINEIRDNAIVQNKQKHTFIWSKNTKKLTQNTILQPKNEIFLKSDKQVSRFDVFNIYIDSTYVNMDTYSYPPNAKVCVSTCQYILPNGAYRTVVMSPIGQTKLKISYENGEYRVVANQIFPCEASKEERRAFLATHFLK